MKLFELEFNNKLYDIFSEKSQDEKEIHLYTIIENNRKNFETKYTIELIEDLKQICGFDMEEELLNILKSEVIMEMKLQLNK